MPTLLGKSVAAQILNCSTITVDRLRKSGKLKYLRVGDSVKFREEDILAYIAQGIETEARKIKVSA